MDFKRRERAIMQMRKTYNPNRLVTIDSLIRRLAAEHPRYGKNMPLCIGKVRHIQNILEIFHGIKASFDYVWLVIEDFVNEPKE